MTHRERPPRTFVLERQSDLPLAFEGWEAARVEDGASHLCLYETEAGHWVTRWSVGMNRYVAVHRTCEDAVRVMGYGPLAMQMRMLFSYDTVEHLA